MKNKADKSVARDIMLYFLLMILGITTVMSVVSHSITLSITERNSIDYTKQLINKLNGEIESYLINMENICDFLNSNPDVREYMTSNIIKNNIEDKIITQLEGIINIRKDISNIVLIKDSGEYIINQRTQSINPYANYKQADWYVKAMSGKGKAVISPSYVQNLIKDNYRWVISMSRAILDNNGNGRGVILVDLKFDTINNICKNIKLGESGYVFVIDESGRIIYHPMQQLLYSNLKTEATEEILIADKDEYTIKNSETGKNYTVRRSANNWRIAGVYIPDELIPSHSLISGAYVGIGIIFSVIAFLLSVVISKRLTKPIKRLSEAMKQAEEGNFDIRVDIESNNEIGRLANVFNIMIAKIKELVIQNTREMSLKRKSELKALHAQINPHFLYNTLDSIVWMAEQGKTGEVVDMTVALANLFRNSISKGEETITIAEEIEHVKAYLTIQKMRYKDKLNFKIDIPEEILQYKIIKLILQPIVENAIYHGIKKSENIGSIIISGFDAGMDIILSVKDNGVGMTQEQIDEIIGRTSDQSIGVPNVNERIKLYYGEEYGLDYESEEGKGTQVIILLPKIE